MAKGGPSVFAAAVADSFAWAHSCSITHVADAQGWAHCYAQITCIDVDYLALL